MTEFLTEIKIDVETAFFNMSLNQQEEFINSYIDNASDDALIEELTSRGFKITSD